MIFDGKAYAREIEERVRQRVEELAVKPHIVSVLVGNDPASELYTRLKKEAAERVGITYEISRLEQSPAGSIEMHISNLGARNDVTGIMVQMPIPGLARDEHEKVLSAIPPSKDVDGLRWRQSNIIPATVRAILSILESVEVSGFRNLFSSTFAVVGSHGSVGAPLVIFLKGRGAERVHEINSTTPKRGEILRTCDVVISCVGKPGMVTEDMISPDCIVVDVGISKVDGKIVGDMTPGVYAKAAVAVPVPGGVGPVTVASLMENAAAVR